jgi:ribosomal protein S20
MDNKKRNAKRYRLHFRIRKQGYRLNTKERTIYVEFETEIKSKQVKKLQNEFGYAIQTEIPSE